MPPLISVIKVLIAAGQSFILIKAAHYRAENTSIVTPPKEPITSDATLSERIFLCDLASKSVKALSLSSLL